MKHNSFLIPAIVIPVALIFVIFYQSTLPPCPTLEELGLRPPLEPIQITEEMQRRVDECNNRLEEPLCVLANRVPAHDAMPASTRPPC